MGPGGEAMGRSKGLEDVWTTLGIVELDDVCNASGEISNWIEWTMNRIGIIICLCLILINRGNNICSSDFIIVILKLFLVFFELNF